MLLRMPLTRRGRFNNLQILGFVAVLLLFLCCVCIWGLGINNNSSTKMMMMMMMMIDDDDDDDD